MNNKIRLVAVESRTAARITPEQRSEFMKNYSFCDNCTTADILKEFRSYVENYTY